MKKLFILLCIVLLFTSNSYGFNELSSSLKNGKVSGEFKIWYQTNDREPNNIFDKHNSLFDAGVRLSYKSDYWNNAYIKLSFFAVDDIGAYDIIAENSCIRSTAKEPATWLGEGYIGYKYSNTHIKIGRQYFKSPLVNTDAWPIFPNNFEGISIKNSDVPKTDIVFGWFLQERRLKKEKFEDLLGNDGVITIGIITKIFPYTTIKGYYYKADESAKDYLWQGKNYKGYINGFYTDFNSKFLLSNFSFSVAGQYMLIDPEENHFDKTDAYGFKFQVSPFKSFSLSFAYSSVSKGYFNCAKFSDNGIKTPLFTATISGDGDIAARPETDSFKVSAIIKPIKKLAVILNYGLYKNDNKWNTLVSNDDTATSQELAVKYTGFSHIDIFTAFVHSDHHGVGAWKGAEDDALNSFRVWVRYYF